MLLRNSQILPRYFKKNLCEISNTLPHFYANVDKEDNLLYSWTSSSKLRFHTILSVWSLTLFGLPQIGIFEALEVVYEMEARKILIFGFKYFRFFFFWVSCIIGLPLTWYVNWGWLWTKNKKEYFYVCGCFASVCAPHANLVSSEARRGYVVPWVAWVLGRELRSSVAFFISSHLSCLLVNCGLVLRFSCWDQRCDPHIGLYAVLGMEHRPGYRARQKRTSLSHNNLSMVFPSEGT